ncbi:GNAT family N-acetyltransferase [Virgibacillus salexigens]|uniref:Alanine acetyltransferase n=1 Tax=Virgibacillus kapii TaxID=1638645 RepID=A0ABQ2DM79_9BACI|nr:GNAT family protein [Virgibacillus kapii]GGJ63886.1 alanine acetyltransferase [Virgibacillus kapii]
MNYQEFEMKQPILHTPRLKLRKITLADLPAMFAYTSLDGVTKYLPFDTHKRVEDTKLFIDYVLDQYTNCRLAPWAIELQSTNTFLGTIEYVFWEQENNTAEIAFVLSNHYWGRGIITEAAREVIRFGFEEMDLERVQARCFNANIASQRVLTKNGFQFEGTLRKRLFSKGKQQDIRVYSLLRQEYSM